MLCEPINELAQQIDINDLKALDQPYFAAQDKLNAKNKKQILLQTPLEYDILPITFNNSNELKAVLSLRGNEYLLCRWNRFLDKNIDGAYPKIVLYSDLKKIKIQPRKLTLNGQFYGVDNKLSPVPVMDDPRNLEKRIYKIKPALCRAPRTVN